MAALYPNQPLSSVAVEIRFRGDLRAESFRSQLQNGYRKKYPNLLVPNAVSSAAPAMQPYRFEDSGYKNGLQFSVCNFGFYSREYPGHQDFIKELDRVLKYFMKYVDNLAVTRIGWRYINEIPFTREKKMIPIHRFLTGENPFQFVQECNFIALSHQTLLRQGDCRLGIKLEANEIASGIGHETLLLDIDAYKIIEKTQVMDSKKIMWRVKRLHGIAYKFFENAISEQYRLFLKGEI